MKNTIKVRKSDIKNWKNRLNKNLIESIEKNVEDAEVTFFILGSNDAVVCKIEGKDGKSIGISIKSPLDTFSEKSGRNRAAGRALKAYTNKTSSNPIRNGYFKFPKSWTRKRIDYLMNFSNKFLYKSLWNEEITVDKFLAVEMGLNY